MRYSPVEGELLAVKDALYKARHFVLGCDKLTVAVVQRVRKRVPWYCTV